MDKKIVIEVLNAMITEKEHEWARNFIARELNEEHSKDELSKEEKAIVNKNIDAATFNIVSAEKDIERLKRFLKLQKSE